MTPSARLGVRFYAKCVLSHGGVSLADVSENYPAPCFLRVALRWRRCRARVRNWRRAQRREASIVPPAAYRGLTSFSTATRLERALIYCYQLGRKPCHSRAKRRGGNSLSF